MPDLAAIIGVLDRNGALHLDEAAQDYGPWSEPEPGEVAYPVDFDALTPDSRHWQSVGWTFLSEDAVDGMFSGGSGLRGRDNVVPPPDVMGWYQPIHFFANNWGIFIRESALVDLVRDLAPRFEKFSSRRPVHEHLAALIRGAFAYVFLHEQYHHKIESLAIRLNVVERRPVYPDFKLHVANVVAGTDDDLQEALASADAWLRLGDSPYARWFASDERAVIREWMQDLFLHSPAGYRKAANYLKERSFLQAENALISQVQEAQVKPARSYQGDFGIATHMTQALFNLKQNIWTLVPIGQHPILPTISGAFPLTTAKLARYLKRRGWQEVPGAGKGSHTKYRLDGQMIVLPHSKDVSLTVLSSTARTLGFRPHELADLAG